MSPRPSILLLYVDEHLVVADKPTGLLVHRGWDDDDDVAMFRVRDALGSHVYPAHRLDRGTSGALLFARSKEVAAALGKLLERGEIAKRYLALVRGTGPLDTRLDYPIPNSEDGPRVPAVTTIRLVKASSVDRCSLMEAIPETGRLHQVRRHLKHLGHPIVGDVNYGSGAINRHYREVYDLRRLALHASSISFVHPVTNEPLEVTAPLPEDLATPFGTLGVA